MVCKGLSKQQCQVSRDCKWIESEKITSHCRKVKGTAQTRQRRQEQREMVLKEMTLKELRKLDLYKFIQGRSKMKKQQIVNALRKLETEGIPSVRVRNSWNTKCKKLEEKCPMSTTLLGDDWCDVSEKDVIYTRDYKMCFEYRELLRLIHEGFVALDTSYEIPQLRLKLPRDPLRQFIPKSVIKKILLNTENFDKNIDYLIDNQELFYFLTHLDDFYNRFDKPQYTSANVNPIQLSKDIEKWLKQYNFPAGGLSLKRYDGGFRVEWEFKQTPKSYQLTKRGKLYVHITE